MKVKKEGMTLRRLITGPIFLLLFLIVTPLIWLLMHAFVYLCKLKIGLLRILGKV